MHTTNYHEWGPCATLTDGRCSIYISLSFGPRIIGLEAGKQNLLGEMAPTGDMETFQLYGGHRLWVAPEDVVVSYEPDNAPVEVTEEGGWTCFTSPLGVSRLAKTLSVRVRETGGGFVIRHQITNRSDADVRVSAWGLTVMTTGGECLIPQPPHADHPGALLPARPMVVWPYTDMSDPRWTWGKRVIRLRHDGDRGPQKIGAMIGEGIATYSVYGQTFVKRFSAEADATYPDLGCNFETFTRQDMLEVESLGPLAYLRPGESTETFETWYVIDEVPPADDAGAGDWMANLATKYPHFETR